MVRLAGQKSIYSSSLLVKPKPLRVPHLNLLQAICYIVYVRTLFNL